MLTRHHWHIENGLHWLRDMASRENESRLRKDNGAPNFAMLRRTSLGRASNLLKQDKTSKVSIKKRRLTGGWDTIVLLRIRTPLYSSFAIALDGDGGDGERRDFDARGHAVLCYGPVHQV